MSAINTYTKIAQNQSATRIESNGKVISVGTATSRLCLVEENAKLRIAAREHFIGFSLFIDKLWSYIPFCKRKWVELKIDDKSVLLNINSLLKRLNHQATASVITRTEVLQSSSKELMQRIQNQLKIIDDSSETLHNNVEIELGEEIIIKQNDKKIVKLFFNEMQKLTELRAACGREIGVDDTFSSLCGAGFVRFAKRKKWSDHSIKKGSRKREAALLKDLIKLGYKIDNVSIQRSPCHPAIQIPHREIAKSFLAAGNPDDNNWRFKDLFGQIYVICGSDERKKNAMQALLGVGLQENDYQISPGVNGQELDEKIWGKIVVTPWSFGNKTKRKGQAGCLLAHLNIFKDAKQKFDQAKQLYEQALSEWSKASADEDEKMTTALKTAEKNLKKRSSILIFEDNVGFGRVLPGNQTASKEGQCKKFLQAISQLPENWDFFYLMSKKEWFRNNSFDYCEDLRELDYGLTTKAYAVNASMFESIIKRLERIKDAHTKNGSVYPVDDELAMMHQMNSTRAYIINRAVCYRQASTSMVGSNVGNEEHWQDDMV